MIFTSFVFVEFFAVLLIVLALCRTRVQRQFVILLASVIFYGSWNPKYLLLLATPSVIDYFSAIRMNATEDSRNRKFWLLCSIVSNLGLLGYFKYANFFVQNFARLSGREMPVLHILLP